MMGTTRYQATVEFACFEDTICPESSVKQWAFYLIGNYCHLAQNDRTLTGLERYFSLDTHYNQRAVRDNPERKKTAEVYRFISTGLDLLVQEMLQQGLLSPEYIASL